MIVLRGNHEDWFLDFPDGNGDEWLAEDEGLNTIKTFLNTEQSDVINEIAVRGNSRKIYSFDLEEKLSL